jgi:acyl dehydratase
MGANLILESRHMTGRPLPSLPRMNAGLLLKALFKKRAASSVQDRFESSYQLEHIDPVLLARYNAALGFRRQGIPVTFHYLLAQRAHLATLLDRPFPFRIPGIVHVENTLQEHAPPDCALPMRLDTTARILPADATGAVHCVFETRGLQAGKLVFTCSSNYLAVRGRRGARSASRHGETLPGPEVGAWKLAPSSGRAYASVSGDWNPIHLWPLTARLMGMRAPIIHGMHTMARTCAFLEDLTGRHVTLVSARFKAPIWLPGEVRLAAALEAGAYAVVCGDRLAVEGSFTTAGLPQVATPA